MNWSALDWGILGPALAAGLLVLLTHISLGARVLDKGIVFIDLAIAQIAGLGVIGADALGLREGGIGVQAAAVAAALAGALLLTWTEKMWPEIQEALIGVMFVLASCAGILMLSNNPHGGEHLKDLLVGQILWVGKTQISWLALGMLTGLVDRLGRFGFYGTFAIAVTASVQLVGVYLVFTSLIVPALATRGLAGRTRFIAGFVVGAIGYALGLALSALLDLPSGAVIVWVLAATAVVFAFAKSRWVSVPASVARVRGWGFSGHGLAGFAGGPCPLAFWARWLSGLEGFPGQARRLGGLFSAHVPRRPAAGSS